MSTQTLLVRVARRSGASRFGRCGIRFTDEWQTVEVDAATAARLKAEQMLEVDDGHRPAPETPVETPVEAALNVPAKPVKKPAKKAA